MSKKSNSQDTTYSLKVPKKLHDKIQDDIQNNDPGIGLKTDITTYPFSDSQTGCKFVTFHGTDVWIDADLQNINEDEREEDIRAFKTALLSLDVEAMQKLVQKNDKGPAFIAYRTREDGYVIRTQPISTQEILLDNPLPTLIKQRIKIKGPITIFDFWAYSQYFPVLGFYDNRRHFDGHFMTASMKPETDYSIGLAYMIAEYANEHEGKIRVLELGPGTGNNMFRILTALTHLSDLARYEVVLVETGEGLQLSQKHKLQNFDVNWIDNIDNIPSDETLTIIIGD